MKIIFDEDKKYSKYKKYSLYFLLALLLNIFDLVLLDYLSLEGLTPDFLLILVVWISLNEGQFIGMISGFIAGLMFDLFSFDVLGTNSLAKVIAALIAGWFYNQNKINENIGSYRFLVIIFVSSLFHNLVYFFMYIKVSEISFLPFFGKYGLAISFYTTVFAIFPMLIRLPKNRLIR